MAKASIPVYDICTIDQRAQKDLLIERFGAYLQKHYQDLHHPHRHSFYHLGITRKDPDVLCQPDCGFLTGNRVLHLVGKKVKKEKKRGGRCGKTSVGKCHVKGLFFSKITVIKIKGHVLLSYCLLSCKHRPAHALSYILPNLRLSCLKLHFFY
ncbi:MAG TPA: hypothetical protein VGN63_07880 [Flavisolibacter sp.]|jgi:hypothetical protein|nr:hypothetical protein [Flavisolibacter sp.]